MVGKACGSGNMLATMLATGKLWACCAVGSSRNRIRARCARTSHVARGMCVVDVALVPDLLPVLPCLELCDAKDRCGCVDVHATEDLQTNGLRDVGARGHGMAHAIAQKMSFVRGQVVEDQRSVQRTARRDRTHHFFLSLRTFRLKEQRHDGSSPVGSKQIR